MTTTNQQREIMSDRKMDPIVWYVYILDQGDRFYVGQTNDIEARLLEHGTKGRSGRLVWFNQASTRESAKTMESRLQRTLDSDPDGIVRLVNQFDRLLAIMRPEKSLMDLQREHRAMESYSRKVFHHIPLRIGQNKTACGEWAYNSQIGTGAKGVGSIEDLRRNDEVLRQVLEATGDEDTARRAAPYGRESCRYCLTGEQSPLAHRE